MATREGHLRRPRHIRLRSADPGRAAGAPPERAAVSAGARAGFAALGVLYFLVGVLALRIALNDSEGQQADRGGVLAELSDKPFGGVLLWALGIGLAGMALWRLSEAVSGGGRPAGKGTGRRLLSVGSFLFYGFVSYSVLAFALGDKGSGSGSSDRQSQDVTAKALDLPGGRWLVGAVAVALVVAGLWLAGQAVLGHYRRDLDRAAIPRRLRPCVDACGVFGGAVRGIVLAAAGGFALTAAVRYEPGQAKGVDDTLRSFAEAPAGPWLLGLVALGLAAFGLHSFAHARWHRL
ncbi:DUF1206 domain-containing protein [Streptomyces sp. NPDC002896]|uniref:DUF1206 domain-containing protein n=1 Tax=Streptomyces sp. NPDC002896 TaxID=3154438 RepID=UPI003320B794